MEKRGLMHINTLNAPHVLRRHSAVRMLDVRQAAIDTRTSELIMIPFYHDTLITEKKCSCNLSIQPYLVQNKCLITISIVPCLATCKGTCQVNLPTEKGTRNHVPVHLS